MRNIDLFDDYINNELSQDERVNFEIRLNTDADFKRDFESHLDFVNQLRENQSKNRLKTLLNKIHFEEFGTDNIVPLRSKQSILQKFGRTLSFAASVAIIAVLATLTVLSAGGYLFKQQKQFQELSATVSEIKASQDGMLDFLMTNAATPKSKNYPLANLSGTGFALNQKGYILTSLHNVKGADSVFVENANQDRCGAHIVFTNNALDLAILKLDADTFLPKKELPYSFNSSEASLGDKVYTLGYTNIDIVYGEGSIASRSGFNGDTCMYQISTPINPGNSGGPLLDENGNIIGMVRGKKSGEDAAGFAMKTQNLQDILKNIDNETLKKELQINTRKNNLRGLKRNEQIRKIEDFVFNIKVYKNN